MVENSKAYKCFLVFDYIIVGFLALLCFLPILHVFAVSLSDRVANSAGMVSFWPVNLNLESYRYMMKDLEFVRALFISVVRTAVGGAVQVAMTILCAYPLSKSSVRMPSRIVYVWFFLIASLFSGGLVPTYLLVKQLGLLNSFWAMIIPGAVPIGNVILMLNFFRNLPKEMEEAALIDGAGQMKVLLHIYIPLSKASIATIALFSMVGHWNSWFDGKIYFTKTAMQPLATYLHTMVSQSTLNVIMETTDMSVLEQLMTITNESLKSAQLFIGMIPILCVYPFIQKYFTKGIVVGSLKG